MLPNVAAFALTDPLIFFRMTASRKQVVAREMCAANWAVRVLLYNCALSKTDSRRLLPLEPCSAVSVQGLSHLSTKDQQPHRAAFIAEYKAKSPEEKLMCRAQVMPCTKVCLAISDFKVFSIILSIIQLALLPSTCVAHLVQRPSHPEGQGQETRGQCQGVGQADQHW